MAEPAGSIDNATTAKPAEAFFVEVDAAYRTLDADLQALGAARPVCNRRGVCCDFRVVEHTLFATAGELARAADAARERADVLARLADVERDERLCPFWTDDHACAARGERPLGCRVYHCDPRFTDATAQGLHERHHRALRDAHERHGIDYTYEPFVAALRRELADATELDSAS